MRTATLDQAKHILVLLGQKNPSKEDLNILFKSGLLSDLFDGDLSQVNRDDFRRFLGLHPLRMKINVDYTLSLEKMISACCYDWVRGDIASRWYPVLGKGKKSLRVEIKQLNCDMSPESAIKETSKKGARPASIAELLSFGLVFPEIQRRFKVVALGSFLEIQGSYNIPYLGMGSRGRILDLLSCSVLDSDCRFLVVYE
jgi:hypothetical protein